MYELTEYILVTLLFIFGAVNAFKQVKGNKVSIKRKRTGSAILTAAGCLIFIWYLISVIQTIQANIIKVYMLTYLMLILSAIWFIVGTYLLIYCKKLGKQE